MRYICRNGKFERVENAAAASNERGHLYGDGLFETMKFADGNISLAAYHFERLFTGLGILRLSHKLSATYLAELIAGICQRNKCSDSARVRLTVFKEQGELNETQASFVMECWPLKERNFLWNAAGLSIDIYEDIKKSCDRFSNLKTTSRSPYILASIHAKQNEIDDAVVLNEHGTIADSSIANVFIVKNDAIVTPSLDQGCVAGVMRRYLIERLQHTRFKVQERSVSIRELNEADEVFLTNAIRGIQWVASYRNKQYKSQISKQLFDDLLLHLTLNNTDQVSPLKNAL